MRKRSIVSMGFSALSQRKMRTSLTTLGIVVGIMTIVAISSLSGGFQTQITNMLTSGFEADVVTVSSGGLFGGGVTLQRQDVNNIGNFTDVTVATGMAQKLVTIFHGGRNVNTTLCGVDFAAFLKVYPDKLTFANGSLPDPVRNNTLILGYSDDPIAQVGQNVTVQFVIGGFLKPKNATFQVEGIFVKVGFAGTTIIDRGAFIPLDTLQSIFREFNVTQNIDTILVKVDSANKAEQVGDRIKTYFSGQASVIVATSFIKSLQSILSIVTVFLLAIGSIALIVAGISIMNITMVSVMERTREIGILKALGARNRTVLAQFLTEAALIGLMGGLIGIPLGLGVAVVLGRVMPAMFSSGSFSGFGGGGGGGFASFGQDLQLNPVIDPVSITTAVLFALAITVIFAIYPARKASKLDPVTALRYE
ncbi:MAG: FtsX-like permease family protein [Promethearchaeati archaeon SRVP18_Atabeyarchaeia-1]